MYSVFELVNFNEIAISFTSVFGSTLHDVITYKSEKYKFVLFFWQIYI